MATRSLLICLFFTSSMASLGWVGLAFPFIETTWSVLQNSNTDNFYVKIYKEGYTSQNRNPTQIQCTLYAQNQGNTSVTTASMSNNPNFNQNGNNDVEFFGSISFATPGLYETSCFCKDTTDNTIFWALYDNNARATVIVNVTGTAPSISTSSTATSASTSSTASSTSSTATSTPSVIVSSTVSSTSAATSVSTSATSASTSATSASTSASSTSTSSIGVSISFSSTSSSATRSSTSTSAAATSTSANSSASATSARSSTSAASSSSTQSSSSGSSTSRASSTTRVSSSQSQIEETDSSSIQTVLSFFAIVASLFVM